MEDMDISILNISQPAHFPGSQADTGAVIVQRDAVRLVGGNTRPIPGSFSSRGSNCGITDHQTAHLKKANQDRKQ